MNIGTLVLDPDDYYAIVIDQPRANNNIPEGYVKLFLSNGLRVCCAVSDLRPIGLRLTSPSADPPALFLEILSSKYH